MSKVKYITVEADHDGRRLDNYLIRLLKGVPKGRLYRALRSGEIRINKKRCKADTRIHAGDEIRLPPLETSVEKTKAGAGVIAAIEQAIIVETKQYILINKPAGIPVHGGTGLTGGLINVLRAARPQEKYLELVHRLDKPTSGCLLIAKKHSVLAALQKLLAERQGITKRYLVLAKGQWKQADTVKLPLHKYELPSGERRVKVDKEQGKAAVTHFEPLLQLDNACLMLATIETGRTHQIRVHAKAAGHPIAGDDKYGDESFNQRVTKLGFRRLGLHSAELSFETQEPAMQMAVCATLDASFLKIIQQLTPSG